MLTFSNLTVVAAVLVGWSFAIWGAVLGVKWVSVDVLGARGSIVWQKLKDGIGFIVGPSTGWAVFPLALELSGIQVPPDYVDLSIGAGVFLGLGAGAVSSKIHDLVLWRAERWIRGDNQGQ